MKNSKKNGFTLMEIMIVVAIISILLTILVPNISRIRVSAQRNTCISNLKQIDSAIILYSTEEGGEAPSIASLVPSYLRSLPVCPAKGTYEISEKKSTCSVAGHELP